MTELEYLTAHAQSKDVVVSGHGALRGPAILRKHNPVANFQHRHPNQPVSIWLKAAIAEFNVLQQDALGFLQYKIHSKCDRLLENDARIRFFTIECYTKSGLFLGVKEDGLREAQVLDFIAVRGASLEQYAREKAI